MTVRVMNTAGTLLPTQSFISLEGECLEYLTQVRLFNHRLPYLAMLIPHYVGGDPTIHTADSSTLNQKLDFSEKEPSGAGYLQSRPTSKRRSELLSVVVMNAGSEVDESPPSTMYEGDDGRVPGIRREADAGLSLARGPLESGGNRRTSSFEDTLPPAYYDLVRPSTRLPE